MPVLLAFGIPFFFFAGIFVIVGLAQSSAAAHGTKSTPGFWDFITGKAYLKQLIGLGHQAASFVASHWAQSQLRHMARWLLAMGTLTAGTFAGNALFAEEIVRAVERVVHRGDPRARAKAATANTHAVKAGHKAQTANAHAAHVGHDLTKYKAKTNTTLHHHAHAIDVTLPRDIGQVRRREDALSRDLEALRERTKAIEDGAAKTWDWLRSHAQSGTFVLFSTAVITALAHMGFGFLRCRNWQNLGKRLTCGMGKWLLDAIEAVAAFALAYLAVLKPEVLAEETVAAVDGIEGLLTRILDN